MKGILNKFKPVTAQLKLKDDKELIYAFLAILSGLISGAVITDCFNNTLKNEAVTLFISYFTEFTDKTKAETFSGIVLEGLIYFSAMFICGSNIFGKELALLLTAIKSVGITAIISSLYSQYALKGFEYCLLIFLPGKILLFFSMLFITKCSYIFSDELRKGISNINELKNKRNVFIIKSLTAFVLIFLSCVIDFVCIIVFSGLFDFK